LNDAAAFSYHLMSKMLGIEQAAREFKPAVKAAKSRIGREFIEWYPYDSLSSAGHIETLLGGNHKYVMESARAEGVLDLGCGDGDFSFFLESLGLKVTAIDYGPSNQNGMRGVFALRDELGSNVTIEQLDVDKGSPLSGNFGVTFCLGVLYHLKNPFFLMSQIAQISQYCVLSTRTAKNLAGGVPFPDGEPLAYLVGENELNSDDTNYWIFTEPALRRLLTRTRWKVLAMMGAGNVAESDPVSADRDGRTFCLLESHYGLRHLELLDGWHHIEEPGWRWTERRFSARPRVLEHPASRVTLRFFIPPASTSQLGDISISCRIGSTGLGTKPIAGPGLQTIAWDIPQSSEAPTVTFEADKALGDASGFSRELGVVVDSLEFS
jgi:2-polyprenyl-3-methyl-5-hydroxy-6-metoxy-1,4-benzoquinol methylase